MILYKVKKNNNEHIAASYGKYYARPVITQTIGLSELAEHMAEHNTGFSPGAVQGLLTDMVRCIKELVLKGIAVKIEDLAIFSIGIRTKKGADSEDEFTVSKNIEGVRLRARATGQFNNTKLNILANLRNAATLLGDGESNGTTTDPSGNPSSPSGSKDDSNNQGTKDDNTGGGSSSGGSTDSGSSGSEGDDGDIHL